MISKLLSRAFGASGSSAERMTGFIARSYYVLGLAGAVVWLFIMYLTLLPNQWHALVSIFNEDYEIPHFARAMEEKAEAYVNAGASLRKERNALEPKQNRPLPHDDYMVVDIHQQGMERFQNQIKRWEQKNGKSYTDHPTFLINPCETRSCPEVEALVGHIPEPKGPISPLASRASFLYSPAVKLPSGRKQLNGVCYTEHNKFVRCNDSYYDYIEAVYNAKGFITRAEVQKGERDKARLEEITAELEALPDHRLAFAASLPDQKKSYQRDAVLFFGISALMVVALGFLVTMPRYGLVAGRQGFVWRLREFWDEFRDEPVGWWVVVFWVVMAGVGVNAAAKKGVLPDQSAVLAAAGGAGFVFAVPFLMLILPTAWMMLWEYIKETPTWRIPFVLGKKGGSARWGGIRAFIKHDIGGFLDQNAEGITRQPQSTIYLGRTLREQDPRLGLRHLGLRTEQHMMTVANTGAGKSRDAIWNTLLSWAGGAFVFDPKGEHTRVTLKRRSQYAKAYVIDPYGAVKDVVKGVHYNPLDEIDPSSPAARDELRNVAEASIYLEKGEGAVSAFFRENAQTILRGFMAHVKTAYPPELRTLPTVYDLLATGQPGGIVPSQKAYDELYVAMLQNEAIDGAARDAASLLNSVTEKEQSGYLSTIKRGIDWINSGPVRDVISQSGPFRMADLKSKETTVYFVLPRKFIVPQMRFIRTLGSLVLDMCDNHCTPQPRGSERQVLMLIDEFKQLGTFEPVQNGLITARDNYVKIWLIVQNVGQIFQYYDNPDDFLGSCDLQFFGLDSMDTRSPELISKGLGQWLDKSREGREGETKYTEYSRQLLTPDEVAAMIDPENPMQIVIPKKGGPLKLVRIPYYRNYKSSQCGDRKKPSR